MVPENPLFPHDRWMRRALALAEEAGRQEEVPVGALIVLDDGAGGRVIGEGFNQREALDDPTAHAEMIAYTQAASQLGSWRLDDCTLYVTLEPCPMCAGAAVNARVPRIVFGATDPKAGACGTLYNIPEDTRLNHRAAVLGGVLQHECGDILSEFFRQRRGKPRRKPKISSSGPAGHERPDAGPSY